MHSKWCVDGKHEWCANRDASEINCDCVCHNPDTRMEVLGLLKKASEKLIAANASFELVAEIMSCWKHVRDSDKLMG